MKACCLTVPWGWGWWPSVGLYSSVLHLDFILALPSTSSDCRVYLAVCLPSVRMLPGEVEGWDARQHCRLVGGENSQCEKMSAREPFTVQHNQGGGGWEFKPTNLTRISHDILLRYKNVVLEATALISLLHSDYTWLRNHPLTIGFEFVISLQKALLIPLIEEQQIYNH